MVKSDCAYIPIGLNAKEGYAAVDLSDSWVEKYRWYIGGDIAKERIKSKIDGKVTKMHHLIVGNPPTGMVVDHIDRDIFNNKRSNLRFVTHQGNQVNKGLSKSNTTGYKGVSYSKSRNKWRAAIEVKGVVHQGGTFDSPHKAALAYNNLATLHHGDIAFLNVIDLLES